MGSISNVKIELYKGSTFKSTIASSTSNDGSFSWSIPSSLTAGKDYKIKIIDTSNSYVYDYSDQFEIKSTPATTSDSDDDTSKASSADTSENNSIPGFNLFILFGSISLVSLGLIFLIKRRWKIDN